MLIRANNNFWIYCKSLVLLLDFSEANGKVD